MSKSRMVWARKYQLLIPVSLKAGTFSTSTESKKLISESLVLRDYVEDRNSHQNNELYEIDEEKTAELMKQREKNIIENAEKAKLENVGMHDLIKAIGASQNPAPVVSVNPVAPVIEKAESKQDEGVDYSSMEVLELQQICMNSHIKFHHKAGKEMLIELIKNS